MPLVLQLVFNPVRTPQLPLSTTSALELLVLCPKTTQRLFYTIQQILYSIIVLYLHYDPIIL